MKGIILAGGSGMRLMPLTLAVSKQLVPIYDKPMIYYPLTTLMLAGIRDILLITTADDQPAFQRLLGTGAQWGLSFTYRVQPKPEGIAQAYVIGADFVGDARSALILGDNLYFGHGLGGLLQRAAQGTEGATIFCCRVANPSSYGVVAFSADGTPCSIEEKPTVPKSDYAVTGLYFYDNRAPQWAQTLKPSARGELEITALNQLYLEAGALNVQLLGRGFDWLDTGTHETLLQAGEFVRTVELRQGLKIGCPEEVALNMNFIDSAQFSALASSFVLTSYGQYLERVLAAHRRLAEPS